MKKIKDYDQKKVFVLGLARSGLAVTKLLKTLGAFVTVNDLHAKSDDPEVLELKELGIDVILGEPPLELFDESYVAVFKTPGIFYNNPLVEKAVALKIPVLTDIELAYAVSEAPIVAITGTNGKTTTTTMIGEMLNAELAPGRAFLAGNIGIPASEVAPLVTKEDIIVMETSSFQLLGTNDFHPVIAVVTNIYSTHLDYHGTQEAYEDAKWQIQKNMTKDDLLILNGNQEKLHKWGAKTQAAVRYFSTEEQSRGAYLENDWLMYDGKKVMAASDVALPGSHNIENALAAITVVKAFGISNAAITHVLSHFHGVKHRTQFLGKIKGRKFYNDSKATNTLAAQKALRGFAPEKTILIAGGLDRGNGFDDLLPDFADLKAIITFGETSEKLQKTAKAAGTKIIKATKDPVSAVPLAFLLSDPDDIILLSPANASWDQYPNFEARGDAFMAAVAALQKEVEK